MIRRAFVALVMVASSAAAYDSRCRAPALFGDDCEGIEAAHTPWVVVEHAELWRRTRVLAGLPDGVDGQFNVITMSNGNLALDAFPSLRPGDLLTDDQVQRSIDIAVFAQLPDLSYTMWDWASGNEGCPPAGLAGEPIASETERCHAFKAHMGWLNSTHFMPQAQRYFEYLHGIALERAGQCATMAAQLSVAALERPDILQACDREALLIEAQAHHYLQDAWSMGHMWQRWGSPEITELQRSIDGNASLVSVKAIGDAIGRASGIIHGAKAITHLTDSMCAPHKGVEFVIGSSSFGGVGDLFLDELYDDSRFAGQRSGLEACAATAMREVYLASARGFGPPNPATVRSADLSTCFLQRATNRSIALGAAIEFPFAGLSPVVGPLLVLASNEWQESLGIEADDDIIYVPLTSELLTSVNGVVEALQDEPLIAEALLGKWHEDMVGIQNILAKTASIAPSGTELAEGDMGSLLGMERNGAYNGVPSYADPPLPWRPEPNVDGGPILPSIENAGNLLARTFVDAHATDWCEAMTRNEDHEFSLEKLRRECDSEGDGCIPCEKFASWHLSSARLGDTPLCEVIAPGSVIISADFIDAASRDDLASQWCRNAPRINIVGRRLVNPGEDALLTANVVGLDDQSVNWSTEVGASISGAGVFRATEPGGYLVSAESIDLPGVTGFFFVDVRDGASLVGTWSGDSLSFDGQDEIPVGSPGPITFTITITNTVPTLNHSGSSYPLTIENGRITGTNGRTDGGRRDVDATVVDNTMIGVITFADGPPPSRIEFDVIQQ